MKRDLPPLTLSLWDYGGQEVFYTLHHVFLSEKGICTVVFDMAEFQSNKQSSLDFLQFWLTSIEIHAPNAPLIIVGTRADKVSNHAQIDKALRKGLSLRSKNTLVLNDKLSFFPINNLSSDPERGAPLRKAIDAAVRKFGSAFLEQKVELRFLLLSVDFSKSSRSIMRLTLVTNSS